MAPTLPRRRSQPTRLYFSSSSSVGVPGKHQQPGRYQLVSLPGYTGEPPAGDNPGAFGADVVATLGRLARMIK
jgi:hypothetical protein